MGGTPASASAGANGGRRAVAAAGRREPKNRRTENRRMSQSCGRRLRHHREGQVPPCPQTPRLTSLPWSPQPDPGRPHSGNQRSGGRHECKKCGASRPKHPHPSASICVHLWFLSPRHQPPLCSVQCAVCSIQCLPATSWVPSLFNNQKSEIRNSIPLSIDVNSPTPA